MGIERCAELADRWDALEGARETGDIIEEEAAGEEGLRRRDEELAALRAEAGVRGVRRPSRCARLEEGSADAMEVSILR